MTKDQIAEIEAVMNGDDFEAKYMAANVDNVIALCQAVRAAWARIRELEDRRMGDRQR